MDATKVTIRQQFLSLLGVGLIFISFPENAEAKIRGKTDLRDKNEAKERAVQKTGNSKAIVSAKEHLEHMIEFMHKVKKASYLKFITEREILRLVSKHSELLVVDIRTNYLVLKMILEKEKVSENQMKPIRDFYSKMRVDELNTHRRIFNQGFKRNKDSSVEYTLNLLITNRRSNSLRSIFSFWKFYNQAMAGNGKGSIIYVSTGRLLGTGSEVMQRLFINQNGLLDVVSYDTYGKGTVKKNLPIEYLESEERRFYSTIESQRVKNFFLGQGEKIENSSETKASDHQRISSAESVLQRKLNNSEQGALEEAHRVGEGEKGRRTETASIGDYTLAQLGKKAEILKKAGFPEKERRILMNNGIVGVSFPWFTRPTVLKKSPDASVNKFRTIFNERGRFQEDNQYGFYKNLYGEEIAVKIVSSDKNKVVVRNVFGQEHTVKEIKNLNYMRIDIKAKEILDEASYVAKEDERYLDNNRDHHDRFLGQNRFGDY